MVVNILPFKVNIFKSVSVLEITKYELNRLKNEFKILKTTDENYIKSHQKLKEKVSNLHKDIETLKTKNCLLLNELKVLDDGKCKVCF